MQKSKYVFWSLFIVIIIVLSVFDLRGIIKSFWFNQDKRFYLVVFILFVIITHVVFKKLNLTIISFFAFLFSFLIEIMQWAFSKGVRQFSMADIFYDLIGICFGIMFILVFERSIKKKAKARV